MNREAICKMLAKILSESQVPMSIALQMGRPTCTVEVSIDDLRAARDELHLFGYLDEDAILEVISKAETLKGDSNV